MKRLIFCFIVSSLLFSTACVRIHMAIHNLEEEAPTTSKYSSSKAISQDQLDSLEPSIRNDILVGSPNCPVEGSRAKEFAQQTDVWCWAASAQTVMRFHGRNDLKQCQIVNDILGQGTNPGPVPKPICCGDGTVFPGTGVQYPGQCWINGRPEWALESQNFDYKVVVDPPLRPEKLANELCTNGPIIFVLLYKDSPGGHSLVVKDMVRDRDGKISHLWVHDHIWIDGVLNEDNDRIPTEYQLWPYQKFAAGLWNGDPHIHESDIVQIQPR